MYQISTDFFYTQNPHYRARKRCGLRREQHFPYMQISSHTDRVINLAGAVVIYDRPVPVADIYYRLGFYLYALVKVLLRSTNIYREEILS